MIESIVAALEVLWGTKLRSALTMLGVIIGVFAVVMLVALGEGAKKYVIIQVQSLGVGAHTMIVHPGKPGPVTRVSSLKVSDCAAMKYEIPEIVDLTPTMLGPADLKYGPRKRTINVFGVDACYTVIANRQVREGRFFADHEVSSHRKAIVIGTTTARELFQGVNPIGERINVSGEKYTVVGILEEKGRLMEFDMDDMAYIPYTCAMSLFNTKFINEVLVLTKGKEYLNQARDHIYEVVKAEHGGKMDFHTHTQDELLKNLDRIMNALTMAVTGIAGVSLLVGGVGIMNIMLVAVTERTREIGLRKSVGATNSDIFQQFVIESGIIGVLGGVVGLGISVFCCSALGYALAFEFVTPMWSIVVGLLFSAFVGLISGVYPAMRAARQDPIQALRYD
ncbi:MAG TPA: ABC transporter permease [Candidatus Brocadiia bacterium]|nr:ABC transporter permease [Candidatus Brocadiia bacterium]